jgi:hypothetical protein
MNSSEDLNPPKHVDPAKEMDNLTQPSITPAISTAKVLDLEDGPLEGVITAEEIYQLERSGITLEDVIEMIEARE